MVNSKITSNDMVDLYFATSSNVKFDQYSLIFKQHNICIKRGMALDSVLIEPQFDANSHNAQTDLVGHPLRLASRFAAKYGQIPYMIEDTMLIIDALSMDPEKSIGLPGADTKNWWINLKAEGVLSILSHYKNRQARFSCQLGAFIGSGKYIFERAETIGYISDKPRVSEIALREYPRSNPHNFHSIFIPEGSNKTFGEMSAKVFSKYDYRRKCAELFSIKLRESISDKQTHQMELF